MNHGIDPRHRTEFFAFLLPFGLLGLSGEARTFQEVLLLLAGVGTTGVLIVAGSQLWRLVIRRGGFFPAASVLIAALAAVVYGLLQARNAMPAGFWWHGFASVAILSILGSWGFAALSLRHGEEKPV